MTIINSHTEIYCIFGNPVKHSLSPLMHNAANKSKNINAVYLAFEIERIQNAIESVRTLRIKGASITIPFKTEVMNHIDEIDDLAADIGSVNTIHNINGKITGYNTDGYGALIPLKNCGKEAGKSRILILGNGGSARAIAFTLLKEGADIIIAGRNIKKVESLANDLSLKYSKISTMIISELTKSFMSDIDIIINTTPLGMTPDTETIPINESLIIKKHVVFDIVYTPHRTKLLNTAEDIGCKVIYGIEMLLNQGIKQFEIWNNIEAPSEIMRKSLEEHLT